MGDIHGEVRSALEEWWAGISPILGPRIKSVILSGSGATGDFAPAVSDIDLYIVVEPALQRAETVPIENWHEPKEKVAAGSSGYWREIMEAQYIPQALVSNARDSFEYLSIRPRSPWWVNRNMSPFSRFTVIGHGICWKGEPLEFARPRDEDLLENIEKEMARWGESSEDKLKDTRWVADKIGRMARYLAYLEDGADLTKTQALERGAKRCPGFASACAAALRYRQLGEGMSAADRGTLRMGFEQSRQAVSTCIQALVDRKR